MLKVTSFPSTITEAPSSKVNSLPFERVISLSIFHSEIVIGLPKKLNLRFSPSSIALVSKEGSISM